MPTTPSSALAKGKLLWWPLRRHNWEEKKRQGHKKTGSPALPPDASFEIQIRAQPRSAALPVAHTCFFHVDIPDYADENEFITKLSTANLECGTFDRV